MEHVSRILVLILWAALGLAGPAHARVDGGHMITICVDGDAAQMRVDASGLPMPQTPETCDCGVCLCTHAGAAPLPVPAVAPLPAPRPHSVPICCLTPLVRLSAPMSVSARGPPSRKDVI